MTGQTEQVGQGEEQAQYRATGKKSRMVPRVNVRSIHRSDCERKGKGGQYTRCQCPKQLFWSDQGKLHRQSAETGDESEALRQANELTNRFRAAVEGKPAPERIERHTIEEAIKLFVDSKRKSNDVETEKHLKRLERELGWFREFTNSKNLLHVTDVKTPHILDYRNSLEGEINTRSAKVSRIVSFFKFCVEMGWIERNIANVSSVKIRPDDPQKPKALTDPEFEQVLAAVSRINGRTTDEQRAKLRCLLLLMRWTGLAIRDAVTIERDRFKPNGNGLYKLFLHRAKTGKPVNCTLDGKIAEEILSSPQTGKYLFVDEVPKDENGKNNLIQNWLVFFPKLSKAADLKDEEGNSLNVTSHWMRHTFVSWCLNQDITLEDTAMLIGDTVEIVAKHYADWVKGRQDRLNERMEKALKQTAEQKTLQAVFGS